MITFNMFSLCDPGTFNFDLLIINHNTCRFCDHLFVSYAADKQTHTQTDVDV